MTPFSVPETSIKTSLEAIRQFSRNAKDQNVRVARLQSEVGMKYCFWGSEFLAEMLRNVLRKMLRNVLRFLGLYFVGPKKSRKVPAKFPTKFPCRKSKGIHRQPSAGAQGEQNKVVKSTLPRSSVTCFLLTQERALYGPMPVKTETFREL